MYGMFFCSVSVCVLHEAAHSSFIFVVFWDLMTFSLLLDHLSSSAAPVVVFQLKSRPSHRKHVALFVCPADGWLCFHGHVCQLHSLFLSLSCRPLSLAALTLRQDSGLCEVKPPEGRWCAVQTVWAIKRFNPIYLHEARLWAQSWHVMRDREMAFGKIVSRVVP